MNELTKKILEALEIEPDVEFEVVNKNINNKRTCKFNSKIKRFETYNISCSKWIEWGRFITFFMADELTIVKSPWKPKLDEKYYFVEENRHINSFNNDNSYLDLMYWHMGNCFKTSEEAIVNKDRIMSLYESGTPLWKKVEDKE